MISIINLLLDGIKNGKWYGSIIVPEILRFPWFFNSITYQGFIRTLVRSTFSHNLRLHAHAFYSGLNFVLFFFIARLPTFAISLTYSSIVPIFLLLSYSKLLHLIMLTPIHWIVMTYTGSLYYFINTFFWVLRFKTIIPKNHEGNSLFVRF